MRAEFVPATSIRKVVVSELTYEQAKKSLKACKDAVRTAQRGELDKYLKTADKVEAFISKVSESIAALEARLYYN